MSENNEDSGRDVGEAPFSVGVKSNMFPRYHHDRDSTHR